MKRVLVLPWSRAPTKSAIAPPLLGKWSARSPPVTGPIIAIHMSLPKRGKALEWRPGGTAGMTSAQGREHGAVPAGPQVARYGAGGFQDHAGQRVPGVGVEQSLGGPDGADRAGHGPVPAHDGGGDARVADRRLLILDRVALLADLPERALQGRPRGLGPPGKGSQVTGERGGTLHLGEAGHDC